LYFTFFRLFFLVFSEMRQFFLVGLFPSMLCISRLFVFFLSSIFLKCVNFVKGEMPHNQKPSPL